MRHLGRLLVVVAFFVAGGSGAFGFGTSEATPLSKAGQIVLSSVYATRDSALMGGGIRFSSNSTYTRHYVTAFDGERAKLASISDSGEKEFLGALISFEIFQICSVAGEPQQAYSNIQRARALIRQAVGERHFTNSESLRLYGDIDSRLINFQGGLAVIRLSEEAKRLYEGSLRYDSKNALSYIGLATWYLFAPAIAGGDAKQTIRLLSLARQHGGRYARYLSYVWDAYAYAKLLDRAKAEAAVSLGLELVPNDPWLLSIRKGLRDGTDILSNLSQGA